MIRFAITVGLHIRFIAVRETEEVDARGSAHEGQHIHVHTTQYCYWMLSPLVAASYNIDLQSARGLHVHTE